MNKDQMQQVLDALTDARKFVNMGFEADEDVYGVHHNDATDAVGYIEQAIAIMQAALAQPVQPTEPVELSDEQINAIWSEPLARSTLSPFGLSRIRAILAAAKRGAV